MAEEKKPKIDLKARLGKKSVSGPGGGGAIPPPVGIPKPGVVPAPPFGKQAPKVDASNPYAAISADQAVRKEPAAIKVEMSDEVVAAQRKGKAKVVALAGVAAVVGGLIGFAFGGRLEAAKSAEAAVAGAEELTDQVDKANQEIESLAETLKTAREKLQQNKYPAEEVSKLGEINIPFTGADLTGKGIGRFKADIVTMLITFASGSHEANDQKEKIQSILSGSKKGIEDFLAQQEKPKIRWGAYFESGPHGPWVSMQPFPEPFLVQEKEQKKGDKPYKWPDSFKITQRGKEYDLKRYSSGDPTRVKQGDTPAMIPVNPETQAQVCPSDVIVRLQRELRGLEEVLLGDKTPGAEKDGLIDTGRAVYDRLKQIGKPH
jgi:uncharacterized protein YcfJ